MQPTNYAEHYNSKIYPSPIDSSTPPKLVYNKMSPLADKIYNSQFHSNYHHGNKLDGKSSNSVDDEIMQKKMQEIFEKKRRRRESHNAVERRRRDNINSRIHELASLLPDSREAEKLNKGAVLRKSVDQIRYLHDELRLNQHRIHELENTLESYRGRLNHRPPGHSTLDLSAIQPHPHH